MTGRRCLSFQPPSLPAPPSRECLFLFLNFQGLIASTPRYQGSDRVHQVFTKDMSTTTAPTLAGDWVPDNQAICLKTDDVWHWDWGIAEDMRTVVGGPSQTTQCLPSGWDSAMTYEGTKCPPRYTKACAADENQDWSAVVCCPTIHKFDCPMASNLASVPNASIFRCVSQYADTGILTMTRTFMNTAESTSIVAESTSIVSASYGPSYHLFALGIIYATPTSVCVCHDLREIESVLHAAKLLT